MARKLEVLVLAASRRDAEMTEGLLADFEIKCVLCSSEIDLISNINEHVGALLLAKEALDFQSVERLSSVLRNQPKWSSMPVILLLSAGDLSSSAALELLSPIPNVTLLERPVRQRTLISVIQSAIADRKRQLELRDSLNEAIEANRAKSEFLANMSHEIRTPLGAVLGFSELLADNHLPEADRKVYLETIRRNGQLLTALINDILDLAKVEAGRLQIELTETSLNQLLSEVLTSLETRAREKSVRLVLIREPNVPEHIKTDQIRLKQILLNVAGNAIKFTEEGTVTIEVSHRDEVLVFRVSDTGIGIKPQQANLLFQSFSQADSSITRRFGGTGLGLVLSKRLAHALGGDLQLVKSKFGVGSVFEFTIALHRQSDNILPGSHTPLPNLEANELKDVHILLVEDSKDNQFLVSRILAFTGAEVTTADNGEEGVQKALKLQPDLILMDVQMPVLSGIDATMALRGHGYTGPIVALTAHALKGDRELCLQAGYTDYLTKPVQRAELYSVLKRALVRGDQESLTQPLNQKTQNANLAHE